MRPRWISLAAILLLAGCELAMVKDPPAGEDPAAVDELTEALNAYRGELGLPAVPASPALAAVAATHLADLRDNGPHEEPGCNLHSWSDAGPWTACCYRGAAEGDCMRDKPAELTGYIHSGYEIAARSNRMGPQLALDGWKGSAPHHDVIANRGPWSDVEWHAMGVAIDGEFAVVWFGKVTDAE